MVWNAWIQPEHIAKWYGPKGMILNVIEHDFVVSGKWKYVIPIPDGNEFISYGKFLEINDFEEMTFTASYRPMTEGLEIQQEKMGVYNGWSPAFDRLETFVTS